MTNPVTVFDCIDSACDVATMLRSHSAYAIPRGKRSYRFIGALVAELHNAGYISDIEEEMVTMLIANMARLDDIGA